MKKILLLLTAFFSPIQHVNAGTPLTWSGGLDPIGEVAESVAGIYDFIFWITVLIFIFVQVVILIAIWKFRRSKNKNAAKFHHNTKLEIFWTVIPTIICAVIAWKSFVAMDFIRTMPKNGLDVEVIAYQFGWDFDYPDVKISAPEPTYPHRRLSSAGEERLVKDLVVPVHTNIKLHITAKDVIHAFFVPALGIKIDAMPGRINYQWFKADRVGNYIGQCAELCGDAHGEMFFNVKVVSQVEYLRWVNRHRAKKGLPSISSLRQLTS